MDVNDMLARLDNGEAVVPGSKVRLRDGTLMLVRMVALTGHGAYVSADDPAESQRPVLVEAEGLGPADYDTQDDLDADALLPVTTYVKKRALDVDPSASRDDKLAAMTLDIMARQRALIAG